MAAGGGGGFVRRRLPLKSTGNDVDALFSFLERLQTSTGTLVVIFS